VKKDILLVLALLVVNLAPAAAVASYSQPGNISIQAGLGPSWGYGVGLNLQAGIDWSLVQALLTPEAPLDFGLSGRVGFFAPSTLNGAAFGTVHYSWKFLGSRWTLLDGMESYAGLGLQFLSSPSLTGYFGASYHFEAPWAFFLETSAFEHGGPVFGASYLF